MTFDSVTRKLSPSALFDGLSYYLTSMTDATGKVRENGWMAASDEQELLGYAKAMGYSIDFAYLGLLDRSVYHCDVVPGTESVVYRQMFPERFCSRILRRG